MGEESHPGGVGSINEMYEREQAGVVRSHFFKGHGSAGCVECTCPVEGDDKGVGRVSCERRASNVVVTPGMPTPSCPTWARSAPMSGSIWRHMIAPRRSHASVMAMGQTALGARRTQAGALALLHLFDCNTKMGLHLASECFELGSTSIQSRVLGGVSTCTQVDG